MDMNNTIPPMGSMGNMPNSNMSSNTTTNEELIEAIIDEKWSELVKDITKLLDWKNATEIKFAKLEQQFVNLKGDFDKLHIGVISKIGDYDKHILDVAAEIQSMEKVFAKILPVFAENVGELNRITEDLKQKVKK